MIPLGYEIGTGQRVKIPLNHMAILGQTQLSGKTTTMEAVALRGDVKAISFITKPGEKSFRLRTQIPAFFCEATVDEYWKHVVAILEYRAETKLGWRERGVVIKLCQNYKKESSRIGVDAKSGKSKRERVKYSWKAPKTLAEFLCNVNAYQQYARGAEEMICIQLREFLAPAIREIERTRFSDKLELARGINVMDITDLSDGLKSLVIRSVIEWVHKHGRKIVVIIPEAWKFIPEGRSTPVKLALEGLIREGAGVGNYVWMDSQDLRGVDKMLLRSVIVWLFGVQRQKNEVANTLASIPDHPKPSATEIMQLGKGEFYVCHGTTLVHTYVQPAGMADEHAQAIARGDECPESWMQIAQSLDSEEKNEFPRETRSDETSVGSADDERSIEKPVESQAGSAGLAASDEAGLAENTNSEDPVWKERYEALKSEFDQLREAHDALAERIRISEAAGETILRIPSTGKPATQTAGKSGADGAGPSAPAIFSNGHLETVWNYVLARAAQEKPPALLRMLIERNEIVVNVERKVIELNDDTVPAGIAKLIADKYFDQPHNGYQTFLELQRRGRRCAKVTVNQALAQVAEMGFLTKEEEGYQAVADLKVTVRTVETRKHESE